MTNRELSQYYWLKKEIAADEERLAELEGKATEAGAAQMTGMPRATEVGRKIERYAVEIAALREVIEEKRERCIQERLRLEEYIAGIPDSMTRLVFIYRCVYRLSWRLVAAKMGGNMSEENARQLYSRYLKTSNF